MFLNLCDCTKNAQQRSQRKTNCKISSQCRSSSNDRASCATQGPVGSALCMHTLSCNCIYNILQSVVRSGQCILWCYEWFCNTRIQADSPKGPSLNAISANRPLSWHSSSASSKKDELQDQLSVQKLEQWSRQLCNTKSSWISALYAHLVLQLYIQYSAVCCPIWTMYLVMLRVILQYAHTRRFSQRSFSQCYKCEQTTLLAFVKCIWRCIPTTGRNIQKNAKNNERNKTHPTLGELPQRMEQWNPHNETTLGKVVGMLKKPWH